MLRKVATERRRYLITSTSQKKSKTNDGQDDSKRQDRKNTGACRSQDVSLSGGFFSVGVDSGICWIGGVARGVRCTGEGRDRRDWWDDDPVVVFSNGEDDFVGGDVSGVVGVWVAVGIEVGDVVEAGAVG